jgi:hypothetical protein
MIIFVAITFYHPNMDKDINLRMENIIEIPKTQVVMAFVATCIEATARLLNVSYKDVYQRMKKVGIIEHYIIPHYEVLHSESRENLAEGMVECLNNWEEKK